ncbi:MAG: hypothetical protein QMD00_05310 [Hadesarchaea archaeon]|nr:hypothetical protein [Hadesarchaea archaeon]
MQVTCVRGRPKLIGRGVYRTVLKVGNLVLKVERGKGKSIEKLRKRAAEVDSHQRKIRGELTFLPDYYGAVLAGVRRDAVVFPAIITFHEYVKPLPTYSIRTLRAIFSLIEKASERGYVLDIKPSNFGEKREKIFYLDEYGIGKGPIPPDVLEDLSKFAKFALKKIKLKKPAWPPSLRKRP